MNKQFKMAAGVMTVFLMVTTIGCGETLKSSTPSNKAAAAGSNTSTEEIATVIAKAQKASDEAVGAIAEAEAVLKTIQDENGNINVSLFQSNQVQSSGLLSPLIERLRGPFDTVLAKVGLVKAKFAEARQLLLSSLAKLNDKDPAQAAMIAEIMKQMAAIDRMEATFRTSMMQLAGKLDLAVAALEKVLSGATNFSAGMGWVINLGLDYFVMGDIRDFVSEIKIKLMAI